MHNSHPSHNSHCTVQGSPSPFRRGEGWERGPFARLRFIVVGLEASLGRRPKRQNNPESGCATRLPSHNLRPNSRKYRNASSPILPMLPIIPIPPMILSLRWRLRFSAVLSHDIVSF
jgi:hypothetical protein